LPHARQEVSAGRGAELARAGHEPHRRRDPDQWCAADLQLLDRIRHRLGALEITGDLSVGEGTLIDDAHGSGRRP